MRYAKFYDDWTDDEQRWFVGQVSEGGFLVGEPVAEGLTTKQAEDVVAALNEYEGWHGPTECGEHMGSSLANLYASDS